MGGVFVGVGGWTFEDWRGPFYPEGLAQKRELEFMSRALTSIEINGTFYRTPKPADFEKWHDETPDGFVFALKTPRFATNRRVLAEAGPSIDRFVSSGLSNLRQKLGPLNWQLAPTKAFDAADFSAFLALLPKEIDGLPLKHAIEVRHASFAHPDALAAARDHGVAIVHAGDSKYPEICEATADFSYLRIMGTSAEHPRGYTADDIDRWAALASTHARAGRDVYLYVISGAKERNPLAAQDLIARLR